MDSRRTDQLKTEKICRLQENMLLSAPIYTVSDMIKLHTQRKTGISGNIIGIMS